MNALLPKHNHETTMATNLDLKSLPPPDDLSSDAKIPGWQSTQTTDIVSSKIWPRKDGREQSYGEWQVKMKKGIVKINELLREKESARRMLEEEVQARLEKSSTSPWLLPKDVLAVFRKLKAMSEEERAQIDAVDYSSPSSLSTKRSAADPPDDASAKRVKEPTKAQYAMLAEVQHGGENIFSKATPQCNEILRDYIDEMRKEYDRVVAASAEKDELIAQLMANDRPKHENTQQISADGVPVPDPPSSATADPSTQIDPDEIFRLQPGVTRAQGDYQARYWQAHAHRLGQENISKTNTIDALKATMSGWQVKYST